MINWMSSWAKGITMAVIISTIIEMILPENSNKKYIKMVIGVYIVFAIISPIIEAVEGKSYEFDSTKYENYFKNTYQTEAEKIEIINSKNIEDIYIDNLKKDIEQKISDKGYIAKEIYIDIKTNEVNYGGIEKIILKLEKKEFGQVNIVEVNKVEINNSYNTNDTKKVKINTSEIRSIKKYLSDTYNIAENNIEIK